MINVTGNGEIIAKDPSVRQILFFSPQGQFLRQVQLPRDLEIFARFADGTYLTWDQKRTADLTSFIDRFVLCAPDFEEEKEVFSLTRPASLPGQKRTVGGMAWVQAVSPERIVIGDSRDGYDLRVFSRNGKLERRIRKEFDPVPISEAFKSAYLERMKDNPLRKDLEFARTWPAFQYMFADDSGRLFVMTREQDPETGKSLCDVFDPAGVFICRIGLGNPSGDYPREARAVRGRIYSIDVNSDGYKVLDVFKMKWE